MPITIEVRTDLTLEAARRVGWQGEGVVIGSTAIARMAAARAAFERLIEDPNVVIYGVTSGYGQQANRRLSAEERKRHASRPQWSVQANDGDPFPDRVVRLMAFARLANFVEGHAAVRPVVAEAVAGLLAGGPMPRVPADGAVSAGEILPLGWLFADLALRIGPQEKESLALINGAPVAAALASDGAFAGEARVGFCEAIFALAAEAYKAPSAHFSPEVSSLSGDPFELAAAQSLAELWNGGALERRPYQAPVSFRILPKMLARLRRAQAQLAEVAGISLSQVSDNPIFLMPDRDHPNGRCVSTGGYHNALAAPALNGVAIAYADLCTIADRLIARLLDGHTSLLPDQLLEGPGDPRYLGTLGFAAVGYGEEARRAAQAVFLPGSESGGFVQNDVSVPTTLAWQGQRRAGEMLDRALGSLAVVASQAFHTMGRDAPAGLRPILELIREISPPMLEAGATGPRAGAIARQLTVLAAPETPHVNARPG